MSMLSNRSKSRLSSSTTLSCFRITGNTSFLMLWSFVFWFLPASSELSKLILLVGLQAKSLLSKLILLKRGVVTTPSSSIDIGRSGAVWMFRGSSDWTFRGSRVWIWLLVLLFSSSLTGTLFALLLWRSFFLIWAVRGRIWFIRLGCPRLNNWWWYTPDFLVILKP